MISSINISGTEYPLRYGMSVHRALDGIDTTTLPIEETVTLIIFHSHISYAKSRQELPALKFHEVADYVESCIVSNDADKIADVLRVVKEWTESQVTTDLVKAANLVNGEEKKSLSPIMSEQPTGS